MNEGQDGDVEDMGVAVVVGMDVMRLEILVVGLRERTKIKSYNNYRTKHSAVPSVVS